MEGRFRSDSAYGWWVFYGNDKVEKKVEYCEGKKMGTPVIIPTAIFQKWRNIRMVLKQENGQIMQHLKETISV